MTATIMPQDPAARELFDEVRRWPIYDAHSHIDALRPEPHPTHFSLDEALAVIERLRPRRAYLTHLTHFYDHGPAEDRLPPGVALAYDGLAIDF